MLIRRALSVTADAGGSTPDSPSGCCFRGTDRKYAPETDEEYPGSTS